MVIFYLFIFFIFYGMFRGVIYQSFIADSIGKAGDQEIRRDNFPGMSFIPNLLRSPASLVWYMQRNQSQSVIKLQITPEKYIRFLDKFLKKYQDAEEDFINNPYSNYVLCNITYRPNRGTCLFPKSALGLCGKKGYGYYTNQPCFYLKVNKYPHWIPEALDANRTVQHIPKQLMEIIRKSSTLEYVWVSCRGLTPMDTEIIGEVTYYPQQGFPFYYYPLKHDRHYLVPLVGVMLNNLRAGYLVTITCNAFAKNIEYSADDEQVRVSFYIDKVVR